MYSKEEKKQLITDFWKGFGAYARAHNSDKQVGNPDLFRKTGIKGVELKFDLSALSVMVTIEINLRGEIGRQEKYERLCQYRVILEQDFVAGLVWDPQYVRESGQLVCRIYRRLDSVNFHNRDKWPEIFAFMATNGTLLRRNLMEIKDLITD